MIPGEIITLAVSALVGLFTRIMENRQKTEEMKIEGLARMSVAEESSFNAARESKASGGKWVRRFLAILAGSYLFVAPYLMPLMNVPTHYAYPEAAAKFLFWGGVDKMKFERLEGFIILPVHVHAGFSIIGFYFGASRRSR